MGGKEDSEDDEDDKQVSPDSLQLRRRLGVLTRRRGWRWWRRPADWLWTPALPPDANSEEGWEYQLSYGGGEEGEDDEEDRQVGSELLLYLLMPTQKRVKSIK